MRGTEMKELLSDFGRLKECVKGSELKFKDAVIEYYKQLGEEQGFTVIRDSTVIKNAVNYGKVELVWVEPNTMFSCEFGVLDDIYRHLFRIMELKPSLAVLLLSGNSQCNPHKVKDIVERTPELKDTEFLVLDVTSDKVV